MFVSSQKELDSLVEQLSSSPVLTLDTEFAAERRYFPRFDLLQLGDAQRAAAIDMHADINLGPLFELLSHPERLVVVHGGNQDMALLFRRMGRLPSRVFDTQTAAAFVGFGHMVGYAPLVKKVLGKVLSKTESLTDWSRRPLKAEQLEYALDDVRFLFPLYEELNSRLEAAQRTDWLFEEMERLYHSSRFLMPEPRERWRRTLGWTNLSPRQLAVLRELAAWRELQAARTDVPARVVLPDDVMTNLSRRTPSHLKELREIRQIYDRTVAESGHDILAAIRRGLEVTDLSEFDRSLGELEQPHYGSAVSFMDAVIQLRAETLGMSAALLATVPDLEGLVRAWRDGRVLPSLFAKGWRAEHVLPWLELAWKGSLSLRLDPGTGRVILEEGARSVVP